MFSKLIRTIAMKQGILFILLLCTTLLNAQVKDVKAWQEIDRLIEKEHYTSAYAQSERLLNEAKCKGDGQAMLLAAIRMGEAAEAYQEEPLSTTLKVYQEIIPLLRGADKGVAYLLLGNLLDCYYGFNHYRSDTGYPLPIMDTLLTTSLDGVELWTKDCFVHAKHLCYEAALAESEAMKLVCADDYAPLVKGDAESLRLRPMLYDVVMHMLIDEISSNEDAMMYVGSLNREQLFGTADEFISLELSDFISSYAKWLLGKLQDYTRYHLNTTDAAVRAHVDSRRFMALKKYIYAHTDYQKGLERLVQSYEGHPAEESMFLYHLAVALSPNIKEYSGEEAVKAGLQRAAKMEECIERIRQIAPESKWKQFGEELFKQVTLPYLSLPSQQTVLPGNAFDMTLTVRNAGSLSYRIVPRYAGETPNDCDRSELMKRSSIGAHRTKIEHLYDNPYQYYNIPIHLPLLEAGDYFLVVTNEGKDQDSRCFSVTALSVSNLKLSLLRNEGKGTYIGMAIDATTGRAITKYEVALMETVNGKTHLIETFIPDAKGYFTMSYPVGKHRKLHIRVSDGTSQVTYGFGYFELSESGSQESAEEGEEDEKVCCSLLPDRYTYKPGEQVQFSLIAYSHSSEGSHVKPNFSMELVFSDSRFEKVASQQVTTDEWGRYTGVFTIPKDATPGRFVLWSEDVEGNHVINVEAFKAPTFKVALERPSTAIAMGDSLVLHGSAIAYSGAPIMGAKVCYEVDVTYAKVLGPNNRYSYKTLPNELVDTTITGAKGLFHIPLKILYPRYLEEDNTYRYTITAHVTDISGETHSVRTSFVVGQRIKYVDFTSPADLVMHGDSIGFSLLSLNDARLAEEVTLRLSKLRVPHSDHILSSVESNRERWDEERVLIHRREQTSIDRNSFLLLTDDMPCGTYRLTVTYTDKGREYEEVYHFELWGEGRGTVSSYALYRASMKKDVVQTGDTAVLYVGTRYEEVYVHYYVRVEDYVADMGTLILNSETSALRIPIREEWRDEIEVFLVAVKDNTERITSKTFDIDFRYNRLNLHLSTLRSSFEPGEKEECTISVSDYYGHPVRAALTLSVYDAALDRYGQNHWEISSAPNTWYGWRCDVKMAKEQLSASNHNPSHKSSENTGITHYALPVRPVLMLYASRATYSSRGSNSKSYDMAEVSVSAKEASGDSAESAESGDGEAQLHLRQNLAHTALYIPTLYTDERGQATFTLNAPDLFSQWHVKGLAHTKDMRHGEVAGTFVTYKTLMVQPNVPRFLYEGDQCALTAKVTNGNKTSVAVKVTLSVDTTTYTKDLLLYGESSVDLSFPITVPDGSTSLAYRIVAQSELHTDGEQGEIAILPRRTLVTETMTLYTNGTEKREFVFDALKGNLSKTLEHKSLRLDIVSNPLWYAIDALSPLCEEGNPSNERLFHSYYAAAMGQYLIDYAPEVEDHSDFFCRDSLSTLQQDLLNRLREAQAADGGWPWMEGFESDRYTTLLIVKGLGELKAMGALRVTSNDSLCAMLERGVRFLDRLYQEDFDAMKEKPQSLYGSPLYYLYARSFFPEIALTPKRHTDYKHYKKLLLKADATSGTLTQKALRMLTLVRFNKHRKAKAIAEVVRQSSLSSDEMGIYWRDNANRWGWNWLWDSNTTTTQALLIEAFVQLRQPTDVIARMQQWLLKQKQTTQWNNSVATAQAVHALLMATPRSLIQEGGVDVTIGNQSVEGLQDGKHGIIRKTWSPMEIAPSLAKVNIQKSSATPSWGAMTWQYFEENDKVESSGSGLSLSTTYYMVEQVGEGEKLTPIADSTWLSKGTRVRVQMRFTADRDMDYVELRLQRPAALEPVSTRSGYSFGYGLHGYRSVENTRNVYYFYRLGKGSYVVDFDLWVSQEGVFSCGVSTIQCMYAPEFVATARSQQLKTGK